MSGGDRIVDLRDHPLQRDHWWGSPEFEATFGSLDINQILDRIASDFGIHADFSVPTPLPSSLVPGLDRTVILVTETDGPAKAWPATKWESLAAQLHQHFDVRQMTRTATGGDLDPLLAQRCWSRTRRGRCRSLVLPWCHRDRHRAHPHRRATANPDYHHLPAGLRVLPSWAPRQSPAGRPLRCGLPDAGADVGLQRTRQPPRLFQWQARTCPSGQRCLTGLQPERVVRLLDELV